MLTAKEARTRALHDIIIFNEVRDIEIAILTAVANGSFSTVVNNTTMTSTETGQEYYIALKTKFNTQYNYQMEKVIDYFSDMGYLIEQSDTSESTFEWHLYW